MRPKVLTITTTLGRGDESPRTEQECEVQG